MPDDDDLQPLTDFNEKSLLTKYADNTYGCVVLVRQPFRSANLLYKNALQKMTEVRTWTECLVKLVDGEESREKTTSTFSRKMVSKKLIFFNLHELVTLSTELEITLEQVINEHTQNQISMPIKSLEAKEEATAAANALKNEDNANEVSLIIYNFKSEF